jgi:hypothetical protein
MFVNRSEQPTVIQVGKTLQAITEPGAQRLLTTSHCDVA